MKTLKENAIAILFMSVLAALVTGAVIFMNAIV
jgi:hypothetical protein